MLILNRKVTETINIGDHLVLTVVSVQRRGSIMLQIGSSQHELPRGVTTEIEPGVTIKLTRVSAGQAKLYIDAPKRIKIWRGEIYAKIQADKAAEARRLAMPQRVGQIICGVFVALSSWPAYLLVASMTVQS